MPSNNTASELVKINKRDLVFMTPFEVRIQEYYLLRISM